MFKSWLNIDGVRTFGGHTCVLLATEIAVEEVSSQIIRDEYITNY